MAAHILGQRRLYPVLAGMALRSSHAHSLWRLTWQALWIHCDMQVLWTMALAGIEQEALVVALCSHVATAAIRAMHVVHVTLSNSCIATLRAQH